jgi:hypothetical protein
LWIEHGASVEEFNTALQASIRKSHNRYYIRKNRAGKSSSKPQKRKKDIDLPTKDDDDDDDAGMNDDLELEDNDENMMIACGEDLMDCNESL